MGNINQSNSKTCLMENRSSFFRSLLLLVAASLAWAPLLQAQTVLMQDDFSYKTDDIDGHSPAKGFDAWKKFYDGVISTDGTQASIINDKLETESSRQAKACYPLDLAENTVYTLKATFKFKPKEKDQGGWVGFGFGISMSGDTEGDGSPWMIIYPQAKSSDNELAHGFAGGERNRAFDYFSIRLFLARHGKNHMEYPHRRGAVFHQQRDPSGLDTEGATLGRCIQGLFRRDGLLQHRQSHKHHANL